MKKISTLLVAGSLAAFSAPAMAQDSGSNFDGFRLQGVAGYDALKAGSSVDDDGNDNNDQSIDGAVYGVQAGYDFDLGGAVIGLEAELTDSTAKTEFNENGDFEGFGLGRVAAVDGDAHAGLCQGFRAGEAKPLRAAENEGRTARNTKVHCHLPDLCAVTGATAGTG